MSKKVFNLVVGISGGIATIEPLWLLFLTQLMKLPL